MYNVDPQNGLGGVSRFVGALRKFAHENPMILFSGDAFNPSILSTYTKGRHMVPFLNMMKIHTACYGNHDFDFGVDHLELLAGSCNFRWLLSNVFDAVTGAPLANGSRYRLCEWQGHKIGIIGLVESAWIETLPHIQPEDLTFQDFVEAGRELCALLRQKGATLIIALTHMRSPNDLLLAKSQPDDGSGIDLILGGHDHDWYGAKQVGNVVIAKSGSDFRDLCRLRIYPGKRIVKERGVHGREICPEPSDPMTVRFDPKPIPPHVDMKDISQDTIRGDGILNCWLNGSVVRWKRIPVETFPAVPSVEAHVKSRLDEMASFMDILIGHSAQPLETRFRKVRTQCTNTGLWLCELMRNHTKADIAVLNSGTIRSDCVFPAGSIRVRDIMSMLPMLDPLCVVRVTPTQLIEILENGVCKYPALEGRFLQVAGVRFSFDPLKPPGQRIDKDSVVVRSKTDYHVYVPYTQLRPGETGWQVAIKDFLREGKDGFETFKKTEVIMDEEVAGYLQTMVRNVFEMAMLASGVKKPGSAITTKQMERVREAEPNALREDLGLANAEGMFVVRVEDDGRINCLNPDPSLQD